MIKIKDKSFPNERDLYASENIHLFSCTFKGKEDGVMIAFLIYDIQCGTIQISQ